MTIERDILEKAIMTAFPDATLEIHDLAGDNDHWKIIVESTQFNGLNRLSQHRLVQEAVSDYDIHALSISTKIKE